MSVKPAVSCLLSAFRKFKMCPHLLTAESWKLEAVFLIGPKSRWTAVACMLNVVFVFTFSAPAGPLHFDHYPRLGGVPASRANDVEFHAVDRDRRCPVTARAVKPFPDR